MQPNDHILAGGVIVVAVAQAFADPEMLKSMPRLTFYKAGAATGILLGGIVLLFWRIAQRPIADFGLGSWAGAAPAVTVALGLAWLLVLVVWVRQALGPLRRPLTRYYGSYGHLLPGRRAELGPAWAAGSLAGFGEEIAFRGFLLWYLQAFTGLTAALILSSVIFGVAHGYQGKAGMIFATIAGLVLAGAYVSSGSLLLALWMHASYNVASFTLGYLLLRDEVRP